MKRPSSVISIDDHQELNEAHQSASTTASISRQISQLFNEPSSFQQPFKSSQSFLSVTGATSGGSNELRKLKHELSVSKIEMQKLVVQIGELQRKLETCTANFEKESKKWEDERMFLLDAVKEGKSKLVEAERKFKQSEEEKTRVKTALSKELIEVKDNLAEAKEKLSEAEGKYLRLKLETENYRQGMESINESLQGMVEEKTVKIEELSEQIWRLNEELDLLKHPSIVNSRKASSLASEPFDERLMSMMSEQSRLEQQIRKLTSENQRLKESNREFVLLRERLHDAEVQLCRMRELEDRLAELESGQQVVTKIMESPVKVLGAPPSVMRELMEKSVEITKLREEASSQRSLVNVKDAELADLKGELENVQKSLAEEKQHRLRIETKLAETEEKCRLQGIELETLKSEY